MGYHFIYPGIKKCKSTQKRNSKLNMEKCVELPFIDLSDQGEGVSRVWWIAPSVCDVLVVA